MLSSAVTTKGQVTIPNFIRQKLHIHPGDKVVFAIEDDHIVIVRKIKDIKASFGLIKTNRTASLSDMETAIQKGSSDAHS